MSYLNKVPVVEEIRIAERARDLLAGLERRLKERDRSNLEKLLGRLERLAGSLPEAHTVRLLAEEAVRSARTRGAGYAGSAVSRSRSKTEGIAEEPERAEAQSATVESQGRVQRPWWRRMFGG
jgi:hypothetical protein